jgi:molybdopterin-biosynthesis enzyme MoeA-like protein
MERGIRLKRWIAVPDHGPSMVSELTRLVLEGFDPVFVSGGMGPTHDDITVASVAEALSLRLVHDKGSARRMEERWTRLNPEKEMPEASRAGIRKMSIVP